MAIWNVKTAEGPQVSEIRRRLAARPEIRVEAPGSAERAQALVVEAIHDGTERVVACGGDGTVNTVVRAIARAGDPDVVLSVLPLGSGNDFCRSAGVSTDAMAALELLETGTLAKLDWIEVEFEAARDRYINMSAAGFSSDVMEHIGRETKQSWGRFAYLREAASQLFRATPRQVEVSFDGKPPESLSIYNVVVGNGQWTAGGLRAAPRAHPADGKMDVVLVLESAIRQAPSFLKALLSGTLAECDQVIYRQASDFKIQSADELVFSADGDVIGRAPARFKVRNGAISVLVGRDYFELERPTAPS